MGGMLYMKRKWLLAICLILAALALGGCSTNPNEEQIVAVTQYIGPEITQAPTEEPTSGGVGIFDTNPYDVDLTGGAGALSEEDSNLTGYEEEDVDPFAYDQQATVFPYAGATPIPIDPVDMPTPTPRAALTFAYVPYQSSLLGLTFEAPANWVPDETMSDTFVLTEPVEQMKDGQLGVIQITRAPVTKQYTESELKSEVIQRIETIGSTNYASFSRTNTATRYMLGSKGVYAKYSGKLASGVENGGRLIVVCIDKVLYCLNVTWPLGFANDYRVIYDQVRDTMKTAQ